MHSLQHMLMYSFFGILGLVVVKTERVRAAAAAEMDGSSSLLPPGADYAALVLALFVEGLLFAFHLHGRGMIDVHVHQLLILAIVAGILAAVVEARMRHQPLAVLARAYSLLIQGSWFCQVSPSFLFSCLRYCFPCPRVLVRVRKCCNTTGKRKVRGCMSCVSHSLMTCPFSSSFPVSLNVSLHL